MINGIVKSVDIDYFDNEILNVLKKKRLIYMTELIADLMANQIINHLEFSSCVYSYIINNLIKRKIINKKLKDNKILLEIINN